MKSKNNSGVGKEFIFAQLPDRQFIMGKLDELLLGTSSNRSCSRENSKKPGPDGFGENFVNFFGSPKKGNIILRLDKSFFNFLSHIYLLLMYVWYPVKTLMIFSEIYKVCHSVLSLLS